MAEQKKDSENPGFLAELEHALNSRLREQETLEDYLKLDDTESITDESDISIDNDSDSDYEADGFSINNDLDNEINAQPSAYIVGDDKSKDFVIQPRYENHNGQARTILKRYDARSGSDCVKTLKQGLEKEGKPAPKKVIITSKKMAFIISAAEEACRQGIDFEFYRTAISSSRIDPQSDGLYLAQLCLIAKSQTEGKSLKETLEKQLETLRTTDNPSLRTICLKAIIRVAAHDQEALQMIVSFDTDSQDLSEHALCNAIQDTVTELTKRENPEEAKKIDQSHASKPEYIQRQVERELSDALQKASAKVALNQTKLANHNRQPAQHNHAFFDSNPRQAISTDTKGMGGSSEISSGVDKQLTETNGSKPTGDAAKKPRPPELDISTLTL